MNETKLPKYFSTIDPVDQQRYLKLRELICPSNKRCRRGSRVDSFQEALKVVKEFCIRNDENDWKRCLVCGVAWVDEGIAINTGQLTCLMGKCKSSINGSFQRLGYMQSIGVGDCTTLVAQTFPEIRHDFSQLRQWTIRQNIKKETIQEFHNDSQFLKPENGLKFISQFDPLLTKDSQRLSVKRPIMPQINLDSLIHPPPRIEGAAPVQIEKLSLVEKEEFVPIFSIDNKKKWFNENPQPFTSDFESFEPGHDLDFHTFDYNDHFNPFSDDGNF